jgi:hypothetical protein
LDHFGESLLGKLATTASGSQYAQAEINTAFPTTKQQIIFGQREDNKVTF